MSSKTVLTVEQVRERFRKQGKTVTEWALENGYTRQAVYRVMGGQDKAYFGKAHAIAVALGLKSSASSDNSNLQTRRAG